MADYNSISKYIVYLLLFLAACSGKPDGQDIIDKTIAVHGGENYNNVHIQFHFRDKLYTILRNEGLYEYSRRYRSTDSVILDKMDNNGFLRKINGNITTVSPEDSANYSASVNSVVYFALLPYALNDAAAIKKYLGKDTIGGQPYYEIKVTFKEEGGGKDNEDEYVYWINQQNYTMDYLAYTFHVEGGGTRFRKAVNPREINGIRFADYLNYKGPMPGKVPLSEFDRLFQQGKLEKVSEIRMEDLQVQPLSEDMDVGIGSGQEE